MDRQGEVAARRGAPPAGGDGQAEWYAWEAINPQRPTEPPAERSRRSKLYGR